MKAAIYGLPPAMSTGKTIRLISGLFQLGTLPLADGINQKQLIGGL